MLNQTRKSFLMSTVSYYVFNMLVSDLMSLEGLEVFPE